MGRELEFVIISSTPLVFSLGASRFRECCCRSCLLLSQYYAFQLLKLLLVKYCAICIRLHLCHLLCQFVLKYIFFLLHDDCRAGSFVHSWARHEILPSQTYVLRLHLHYLIKNHRYEQFNLTTFNNLLETQDKICRGVTRVGTSGFFFVLVEILTSFKPCSSLNSP